ncbi:transposable element gene, partial [Prunus dulcis]
SIIIYVLTYVDDIIITGNNGAAIDNVISTLSLQLALKDLGKLHYFLGIEVIPQSRGLLLSQRKYILYMKPTYTLMASSTKLSALQYVTLTCPKLAFSVNKVCQFMHNPTTEHWTAVKRILRYLKHALSHDWAGFPYDRRSTGGYVIYLGCNLVSWFGQKQLTVPRPNIAPLPILLVKLLGWFLC